ncbi:MAG: sigma-70 family RNA polymerase sigma factor [Lentisphaeraceae bacterium]|nr:sigma-70 family RNA polymerase sigma factor [Lentisphaeraceae bacterium]
MKPRTRQTLIQRIRDCRDENSWTEFVHIYRPYIYTIIKNMGVIENEIEDHVQSVLVICWQKIPNFDYDPQKGRFCFWLSRISTYTVNNHVRKLSRRRELVEDIEIPISIPAEIEEMSEYEWKTFISKMAWDNIKDDLAEKVRLSFEAIMDGQKPAAIGLSLDVAENTIHVYKSRVEKKLYKEIQRLKRELN